MSKRTRQIIIVSCLIVIVAMACFILYYTMTQAQNNAIYERLKVQAGSWFNTGDVNTIVIDLAADPNNDWTNPEDPNDQSANPVVSNVQNTGELDFKALWEINTDVYAWLDIPGTSIAYPVLQHPTDNTYYLNHTIEHVNAYPGAIYTENWNAKDFSDYNTVIYGHNMANGTMFGTLKSFRDGSYFDNHRNITVYTPYETLHYTIYAAVVYTDDHILSAFDFNTESGRQGFLDSISGSRNLGNHIADDVPVTANSKLLTLTTCVGSQPENRYLVVAVLDEGSNG